MPIYMDIHQVPGVEALDAAEAHQKDMQIQHEYRCKCMTYWIDEPRGVVFCLIEGPDRTSVEAMHQQAHGLMPHKIIEVSPAIVEGFLGRIHDPEEAVVSNQGLKVFSDSAFRVLLVTDHSDPVLLRHRLGAENANALLKGINSLVRKALTEQGGRIAEHTGNGYIASFSSSAKAMNCALDIHTNLSKEQRKTAGFKMGISAGEPISKSDRIFGDTIQQARRLCTLVSKDQIMISSLVKELLTREHVQLPKKNILVPSPQDEVLVDSLFNRLEENWRDPDFSVEAFCKKVSMSKSQLYRKTVGLWGLSPNQLLKDYRLDKAREMLRSQSNNIAQTTFESGFTSPSYFTKCFKKKFGLLPAAYQGSL